MTATAQTHSPARWIALVVLLLLIFAGVNRIFKSAAGSSGGADSQPFPRSIILTRPKFETADESTSQTSLSQGDDLALQANQPQASSHISKPNVPTSDLSSAPPTPHDKPVSAASAPAASILYFHSSQFLSLSTDKAEASSQIARLKTAANQVGASHPGALIFDVDGISTDTVPFLLLSNPAFDITPEIESAFNRDTSH